MSVRIIFSNGSKCGKLKTESGGSWFSYAGIAQSVEQLIRNQQASGSSPLTSSIKSVSCSDGLFVFGDVCMSEREYEALRSALASTRMEGFDVTEQTEKDCVRLMSGEVSVADLVKEILSRPTKAV